MNRTKIEYLDWTWNPYTGCRKLCRNEKGKIYCWAYHMATTRLKHRYPNGFAPTFWKERLNEPSEIKKPSIIRVCFMGDLFGWWVLKTWVTPILQVVRENPQHRFIFLTKFPQRLSKFEFPQNAWVGTSIDRQDGIGQIEYLKRVPNVRFISFEPLLEQVDPFLYGIDLIIIGGCTGRYRFTPPKEWVDSLIREARNRGVAVFLKDNLGYPHQIQEWPERSPAYHDDGIQCVGCGGLMVLDEVVGEMVCEKCLGEELKEPEDLQFEDMEL